MKILPVNDVAFRKYGRVVKNVDFTELVKVLETTPVSQDVVYEPSVKQLEELPVMKILTEKTYGELPVQVGYCNEIGRAHV